MVLTFLLPLPVITWEKCHRAAVLYTPPPVLLDSDWTAQSLSEVLMESNWTHFTLLDLYFEVYFTSGVQVESEWTNPLNAVQAI
jgi:hypothetical protein